MAAYLCPAGKWPIGYEHTAGVVQEMTITQAKAEAFLKQDIEKFEKLVEKYNSKYNWNQNEFDALMSFAFNIGSIDQMTAKGIRDRAPIAAKLLEYSKARGKVLPGLLK